MYFLPGIMKAMLFAVLAYGVVVLTMNLAIRGLTRSAVQLPLLPRYAPEVSLSLNATDFEQFIVERFDPGHFRIMKWSKKYSGGIFETPGDLAPDLEYQALVHKLVIPFAVECEWRPGFTDGSLDLAGFRLFPNYRRPGAETEIPVFLVVGIGGTQSAPAECYILPMELIPPQAAFLSREFLEPFRRSQPDSVLFLDISEMQLR